MNECFNCMFMHPDWDVNGNIIRPEYCHYVGPDEWAPCAEEEYELEPDPAEEWLREETSSAYDLGWFDNEREKAFEELFEATLEAMSDPIEEPTFEEYGAPYDYKEF